MIAVYQNEATATAAVRFFLLIHSKENHPALLLLVLDERGRWESAGITNSRPGSFLFSGGKDSASGSQGRLD